MYIFCNFIPQNFVLLIHNIAETTDTVESSMQNSTDTSPKSETIYFHVFQCICDYHTMITHAHRWLMTILSF